MKRFATTALTLLALSGTAYAQDYGTAFGCFGPSCSGGGFSPASPSQVAVLPSDVVMIGRLANNNNAIFTGAYLPLSNLAAANQQMTNIANQVASLQKHSLEVGALAASFNIPTPNKGDRFAVSFSGAGWEGYGAGSISGSYQIAERALLFAGYARSSTQNMAKAGMSISIR